MPKSFLDLPVEINLQILRECGPNDVTCLSLTCKYLYSVSEEFKVPRPNLSTVDSRLCPEPKWCPHNHSPGRTCKNVLRHRRRCHNESRAVHKSQELPQDKSAPYAGLGNCKTPRWTPHCECFVVTLYKRLESWVPPDLKFCINCRKFTYVCSKDNRRCGMNARIAKFDLVERELWKRMEEKRQWGVEVGWEERGFVTVAGSSQNGAAMTLTAQTRMRETRRLMQKEAREEILKKREEIKRQEEELGRKEEELRKMEEELQRRAEEIRENERKIRKREEQVRKREEEMGKKGRSNKEERRGGKENKKGFPRFLSRN